MQENLFSKDCNKNPFSGDCSNFFIIAYPIIEDEDPLSGEYNLNKNLQPWIPPQKQSIPEEFFSRGQLLPLLPSWVPHNWGTTDDDPASCGHRGDERYRREG